MNYIFLSKSFYLKYDAINYPEIERKEERPYIMIEIKIDNLDFAIPLRSGISHNNAFWTNKKDKCGADYSKSVIILDESYIDSRKPYIRPNEHKYLSGKEYLLEKGFKKYIEDYKKALKEIHIHRNKMLCKFSTLQYYHKEINIT